jgi:propionyl-CoA synthetase
MASDYAGTYAESLGDPEAFWLKAAAAIDWDVPPSRAHDGAHWFADARLNTCFNAVDRHVLAGRGADTALIHDSPMTGTRRRFDFDDLLAEVSRLAGAIAALGVGAGDRVIIFMPMIPEAVFAMLACARLGAVHSVVFGGFAGAELAKRIDDATPKLILMASCGLEPRGPIAYMPLVEEALALSRHRVERCLVLQRPQLPATLDPDRDLDWTEAVAGAAPAACVSVAATDPLYILYTSGTTGVPKGVVRDNGGHAVMLAWSMRAVYGAAQGETFWAASDIGWVVGHSYIVYAPLLHGCATLLYEGKPVGTPDAGAFWRVVRDHDVSILFTAPTAIRAIRREDPDGEHLARGIGPLRALFLAGERADPPTVEWAANALSVPVIDHWWQTELGAPALATCLGLGEREIVVGAAGRPVPGYRFAALDESGHPLEAGTIGDLAIALPLPPGCATTLWRNDAGYRASYLERHPGYYATGDAAEIDARGFVHVMSRTDDIINVAGHRLSTGAIEQILAGHPDVAECAVVGMADALKGEVPFGLVVLKAGTGMAEPILRAALIDEVRRRLGPVASFKLVTIVQALPKTRSGKILRGAIRGIVNGHKPVPVATIEDPGVLAALERALPKLPRD